MIKDKLVEISGRQFECVDGGFGENAHVDVVIRPEDIKIVPADDALLCGVVESVIFKGVHYEMIIDAYDNRWIVQSAIPAEAGQRVGIQFTPVDIHIMNKMGDSKGAFDEE